MVTSAIPIGARLRVPLKMTSSIFSPRSDFALCSPRTQAIASETLLFPHPFGPTIAVIPDSLTAISPRSEKDLKPISSMRRNFNTACSQVVLLPEFELFVALSFLGPCDRLGPFSRHSRHSRQDFQLYFAGSLRYCRLKG